MNPQMPCEMPCVHVPLPTARIAFKFYIKSFGAKCLEINTPQYPFMDSMLKSYMFVGDINGVKLAICDAIVLDREWLNTRAYKMTIHVSDPLKFANLALEHSVILFKISRRDDGFCCLISILDPFRINWTFVHPEDALVFGTPEGSSFFNPQEDEFNLNVPEERYLLERPIMDMGSVHALFRYVPEGTLIGPGGSEDGLHPKMNHYCYMCCKILTPDDEDASKDAGLLDAPEESEYAGFLDPPNIMLCRTCWNKSNQRSDGTWVLYAPKINFCRPGLNKLEQGSKDALLLDVPEGSSAVGVMDSNGTKEEKE